MGLIFDDALLNYWMPIMGLLILIAVFVNIVVYLLGIFIQNDKIKGAAKTGFVEIFYSAVIIAFVMFTVNTGNSLVKSLVVDTNGEFSVYYPVGRNLVGSAALGRTFLDYSYEPVDLCKETGTFLADNPNSPYYWDPVKKEGIPYCHIRVAMYFLNTLFGELDDFNFHVYLSSLLSSTLADFAINIEFVFEKAGFFTLTPWRGFVVLGNLMKTFIFETAIKIMTLLKFQEVLISFISQALFPGLFILGIIMRTFVFTRKLGGLLMAIALVLFFIFPMFYVFPGIIIKHIKDELRTADDLDPKIAHYIYASGNITILGSKLDLGKEAEEYRKLDVYIKSEGGGDHKKSLEDGELLRPSGEDSAYNFNTGNRVTDRDQALRAFKDNYDVGMKWFQNISSSKWYDPFPGSAFDNGGIFDMLARYAFFSIFFGLLGILASIAAIRSLSMVLGGDIEIAGLTHLI
ncbi:hypothetical protein J4450_00400 [Candidatus Micrarchaeota archaeon]|nr:hypothetical protein [Candidatus Micrarchaeota archaeon]